MALIRGKSVQEDSGTQYPANPRLWNLITMQAKIRFPKYPSPAAAHWVHTRYTQLGGSFVSSKKDIDPKMRDYAQEKRDKEEKAAKKKVVKPVGKGRLTGEGFKHF